MHASLISTKELLKDGGEATLKPRKSLLKKNRVIGRRGAFTVEPQKYVKKLVEDNPQTTVDDVLQNLTSEFEGLSISRTQLHYHMKKTLNLTVKYPTFEAVARNDPDNLEKRFQWFQLYKDTDLDYLRNCVFIVEAGFHSPRKAPERL